MATNALVGFDLPCNITLRDDFCPSSGANQVTAAPGTHTIGGLVAEARRRLELPAPPTSGRDALRKRLASVQWPYLEANADSPYVDPATLVLRAEVEQPDTSAFSKL
eukprot:COSAG02_NODE_17353_length_1010_cov_1.162459_2_plen_107_part_00